MRRYAMRIFHKAEGGIVLFCKFPALTTCAEIRKGPCFQNQPHAGSHSTLPTASWCSPPAHGSYIIVGVVLYDMRWVYFTRCVHGMHTHYNAIMGWHVCACARGRTQER